MKEIIKSEIYAIYTDYDEAIKDAHILNLSVPDGVPKWVVDESSCPCGNCEEHKRWSVTRFS